MEIPHKIGNEIVNYNPRCTYCPLVPKRDTFYATDGTPLKTIILLSNREKKYEVYQSLFFLQTINVVTSGLSAQRPSLLSTTTIGSGSFRGEFIRDVNIILTILVTGYPFCLVVKFRKFQKVCYIKLP